MYYYGLRSSAPYLESIEKIRVDTRPHHLTSVIGGFAFLHAISDATRSITLIDTDPDALKHWNLIQSLIRSACSLEEFRRFLSGQPPQSLELDPLYRSTYGSISLDEHGEVGRIGDSTIHFSGTDLRPMHFCWYFGRYNFSSNETFVTLQRVLRERRVNASCGELQRLDYGESSPEINHLVLASNCESPLFTKGDVIYRQVYDTARGPVRFVSWLRDGWIDKESSTAHPMELSSLPENDNWFIASEQESFPPSLFSQSSFGIGVADEEALTREVIYGREMLILYGGDPKRFELITSIAPAFKRILWIESCGIEACSEEIVRELLSRYLVREISDVPGSILFELRNLR